MKNFKLKRSNKLLSLFLVLVIIIINTSNLYAFTEDIEKNDMPSECLLINNDNKHYEEALRVLGLTEDEAKECNIYLIDGKLIDKSKGITIPNNGNYYYFNEFTFYDKNYGSYWTCNGSQLKWGYTWYCTYGENIGQYLKVYLYQFPSEIKDLVDASLRYNGAGYTSNWLSVNKCDHRFIYETEIVSSPETAYATVKMYVATRN